MRSAQMAPTFKICGDFDKIGNRDFHNLDLEFAIRNWTMAPSARSAYGDDVRLGIWKTNVVAMCAPRRWRRRSSKMKFI